MELEFEERDVEDYVTVPAGTYLCEIAEVRPGQTRGGDDRWGLRLVVAEGEFIGRQAAWDGLVFSTRGRHRVRTVFAALGMPSRGRVSVEPEQLVGRRAFVTVRPVEYTHQTSGQVVRRNEVPYEGYAAVPDGPTEPKAGDGSEDSIPF